MGGAHLGDLLRQRSERIIQLWADQVRSEISASKDLEATSLINSIPQLLEKLAENLESSEKSKRPEIKIARLHGEERACLPLYSIEQVIDEYRLLRRVIFEEIGDDPEISPVERNAIIDVIELGIAEAASAFSDSQQSLRDQFISVLAHDLRNPLTAARGSAQLILRYPENLNTVTVLAARIVDSTSRADRLIQDLLDLNRMRVGENLPLKMDGADLRSVINTTLEGVASIAGAVTEFTPPPNPVFGFWDTSLIKRAIENLVINAKKYGDPNFPIKVEINQAEGQVKVSVHNEGSPLSSAEQAAIFDPIQRMNIANKSKGAGWGLGLSIINSVARAHNGTVSLESDEKHGTTFTLVLPLDARPHTLDPVASA